MYIASLHMQQANKAAPLEIDYMAYSLLEKYVTKVVQTFNTRQACLCPSDQDDGHLVAERIFNKLTNRQFAYLSKKRVAPYRDAVLSRLHRNIIQRQPVQFYYDLGPGYHASIDPGNRQLSYDVGLGEIMALRQIHLFCRQIDQIYKYGAVFHIVIDNLCAYFTNDISIGKTTNYITELRKLIAEIGCQSHVSVLAESEQFSIEEYEYYFNQGEQHGASPALSMADIENVSRFLGRKCSPGEAEHRVARYQKAGEVTEMLLEPVVKGVRLTQRATPHTLGFRSFPGSDQRIQVGQLVLKVTEKETVQPTLITSKNYSLFHLHQLEFPRILPPSISAIPFAALV